MPEMHSALAGLSSGVTTSPETGNAWARPRGRKARAQRPSTHLRLIFVGILLMLGIFCTSRSGLLRYLLPAFALMGGYSMVRASRAHYVCFTLWLWFLAPFVRRLVDFRSGTNDGAIMLLAPYLASCVPLYFLFRSWQSLTDRRFVPLLCMFAAILYGTLIGLWTFAAGAVIQGTLMWLAPLSFAMYLNEQRAHFREIFGAFESTMIYGTLLAAAYGIFQYFALPRWDQLWMENLNNPAFGIPRALDVRVFSVMNAPQILGLFLTAGVLLALRSKHWIRFAAAPLGIVALAFTMARTAWVSLAVGMIYFVAKGSTRMRLQAVFIGAASVFVCGAALQDPQVAAAVSDRFSTLFDVGHDDSFVTRLEGHAVLFDAMAERPFGLGLGGQATGGDSAKELAIARGGRFVMQNDSTVAAILLSLGGAGAVLAAVSFWLLGAAIINLRSKRGSPNEALCMLALVIAAEAPFDNVVNGPGGFLTWTILGLCLAAPQIAEQFRPAIAPACALRAGAVSGQGLGTL